MGLWKAAKSVVGAAKQAGAAKRWIQDRVTEGRNPQQIGQEILKAVAQAIQEVGVTSKEALQDEAVLEKAVSRAHGLLPFWIRAVLPQRLLHALVRQLNARIEIQSGIVRIGDGAADIVLAAVSRLDGATSQSDTAAPTSAQTAPTATDIPESLRGEESRSE